MAQGRDEGLRSPVTERGLSSSAAVPAPPSRVILVVVPVSSIKASLSSRLFIQGCRSASSGILMSPAASTQLTRTSACADSGPPPGGRPCRSGVIDPVRALRCANRTAVAALTPNRRAAARH